MKMHFPKMKSQVANYRKYKDFHKATFLDSLRHELHIQGQIHLLLFVLEFLIDMLLKKTIYVI